MSFGVKHFQTITASIINYFSGVSQKVTDFNVGSKIRTIFEAVAIEIEQVYYQLYIGINDGIKDAIFNSFNFPLLPAKQATGIVRFSRSTPAGVDYPIPAGTTVITEATDLQSSVSYHTLEDATLLTGDTFVDVEVICEVEGAVGNVEANKIIIMTSAPAGIENVTNSNKFSTGRDEETEDARKTRFQNYIDNLSRATLPALEYGAKTVPDVIDAIAVETPNCSCFAYDDSTDIYTDNSFEANMPTGIPFYALSVPANIDDSMYIGADSHFDAIRFDMSVVRVGSALVWEYFDGSAWQSLATTDDTNFLANDGIVSFTMPTDWKMTIINGVKKFWIRLRVTSAGISQVPKIFMITLPPFQGIIYIIAYDSTMTASPALISEITQAIENYRASGIKVVVKPPVVTNLNITITLTIAPDANITVIKDTVKQSISDWLTEFTLDRDLILSELVQYIENLDTNIWEVIINSPTENYITSSDEVLRAGTIIVN